MKILNLEAFRKLPPNTLFAKYQPCVFEDLQIKGETWEHDFLATDSLSSSINCAGSAEFYELLDHALATGESLEMDFEKTSRDGCYENDQLFAVFEEDDVKALIERLMKCLPRTAKLDTVSNSESSFPNWEN